MRRTLLSAIAVSVWASVVAAGQQQPATGPLPAALRPRLQNGTFQIVTSVRGLPLGVRERMTAMFGGALDIAEPGAAFQTTDLLVSPRLPIRRMVAAACSNDFYCLVYYERGGIAHTWHVALFHWSPDDTRFEWGSTASGAYKTIEDVRKAILSGAIKGSSGPW
jgi:hypothetical protein